MNDEARPIAWAALEKGTAVVSSDGEDLGKVAGVVADEQKDIFSGITIRDGILDRERFVPADAVAEMTTDRVTLTLSSQQAGDLEPYSG